MPTIPLTNAVSPNTAPQGPLPSLLRTPAGLALVEIQGTLNLPPESSDDAASSLHIGRLEFPALQSADDVTSEKPGAWMKKVYLYVGDRQRLVGEAKKLERPFAVVRRRDDEQSDGAQDELLEIMDVVKYKLHFGGRPEFV